MDIYNNLNVAGDVKANKVNLSDRVVVSVDGITNSGIQYCFPACSGTIATQSYVDEKICGIVIDAYTKAEVDEKVNCLEGSIASVETDVSNKASQFCLTCHEAKVGGASQIGHVKVASSFGSSETCVVPSLSLVCSTFGGYVTTTCFNAYKNTTICNFNFIAGCIEGVRCYVADVESDLTTAKQSIQQNTSDIAALQASSGCLENVYTKSEVDEKLANLPISNEVYTKTETDELLSSKANSSSLTDLTTRVTKAETIIPISSYAAPNYYFKRDHNLHMNSQSITGANYVSAGSFTEGGANLSDKYSAKSDLEAEITRATEKEAVLEAAVATKADAATTLAGYGITDAYTKAEVDSTISGKANTTAVSALAVRVLDVESALSGKADAATTYTKTEVDSALSSKANTSDIPDVSGKADSSDLSALETRVAANETALGGHKIVSLTQSEYDALTTKDAVTLYLIVG